MSGLTPIPDDSALADHLADRIDADTFLLDAYLEELDSTVEDCETGYMPTVFAYGKMLNMFRDTDHEQLLRVASAAMWKLHGQNNAEVTALPTETDNGDTQIDGTSRSGD